MRNRKWIWMLLALLLLCGCGETPAEPAEPQAPDEPEKPAISDELTVADETENRLVDSFFSLYYESAEPLHPYSTNNRHNLLITQLVYEGLYELDAAFKPQPIIASRCETEDYVNFELTIRSGLRFSDGSPLTAMDVVYSINEARSSRLYSARLADIAACDMTGLYSVSITLSSANCRFTSLLDFPIIPDGSAEDPVPLGSGPYEFVRGTEYAYLRPNEHWQVEAELRQIYLYEDASGLKTSYFESGQTDLVVFEPLETGALSYGGDYELTRYDTSVMHYLGVNLRGSLSRAELRQIVAAVIDREAVALEALESAVRPTVLPINPASGDYSERIAKKFDYSLERAAELLEGFELSDTDEDGAIELSDGTYSFEMELELIVNSESSQRCAAAHQIAEQLALMGIKVHVLELYWDDYIDALKDGSYDLYYGVTKLSADFDLDPLLSSGGSLNYSHGYDDEYYLLSREWRSTGRTSDLNELMTCVCEHAQIIPLAFERHQIITHRNLVLGMQPTQGNVFAGIEGWTIK